MSVLRRSSTHAEPVRCDPEDPGEASEKLINPYRARHLSVGRGAVETANGRMAVAINEAESPLLWLARRKSRDGRTLIEPVQFVAGERLRADFTYAQLMPRVTANWDPSAAVKGRLPGDNRCNVADAAIAARQRVDLALNAVGPEFAGLLVDICCFLKGLEVVEAERRWPPRCAKVVLQLGLDRLARHYGLQAAALGKGRAPMRAWVAVEEEGSPAG